MPASAQAVSFSGPTSFPTVGGNPISIAVGDFNGDSRPDLATADDCSDTVSILLGDGNGGFGGPTPFPTGGSCAISVVAADFNGDSRLDLAVANILSANVAIMLGDGTGGFGGPTTFPVGPDPWWVAVGDFNGDSRPDLATANFSGADVSILIGNGSGGFTGPTNFPVGFSPFSILVADFNGDSRKDIAVANSDVAILLGDGNGGFTGPTHIPVGSGSSTIAAGDFNGDSRTDLAVADYGANDVSVLLGNGSGGFSGPTHYPMGGSTHPRAITVGDFDLDSHTDIAVANWSTSTVSILLGNGSGSFTGPTNFSAGNTSIAAGDFNRDSRPDLAAGFYSPGYVAVLLNTSRAYSRPIGASPMRLSLVPAFQPCATANALHQGPLTGSSCSPPAPRSSLVAVGSVSLAFAGLTVLGQGQCAAFDSTHCYPDATIRLSITDVRSGSPTGGDYDPPGSTDLTATATIPDAGQGDGVQITDQGNQTNPSGPFDKAATGVPLSFPIPVACTPTADPAVGSSCETKTTINTLVPGAAVVGNRAIWELGQLQVLDRGSNGTPGDSDDQVFEVQGVFVP